MKKIICIFPLLITVIMTTGAGYVGTLPNVDAEFSYLRKEASEKSSAPFSVEELDKQNEKKLKPIPRDNDDYVDIMIKKEKTSQYTKDVNSIIFILEKLRKCLNTNGNIQMFNAIVSNLIDHVDCLKEEYKDKPESNYLSYRKLIELSSIAANTAKIRTNTAYNQKYVPLSSPGNIYTPDNVELYLENLLENVNDTIYILKNLE